MLRQEGVLQRNEIGGARVYTCGYRDCITRAEITIDYFPNQYKRTAEGKPVTLDIALGGLTVGIGKARRKIRRAIRAYEEGESARRTFQRQQQFFNQFQDPPKPKKRRKRLSAFPSWRR